MLSFEPTLCCSHIFHQSFEQSCGSIVGTGELLFWAQRYISLTPTDSGSLAAAYWQQDSLSLYVGPSFSLLKAVALSCSSLISQSIIVVQSVRDVSLLFAGLSSFPISLSISTVFFALSFALVMLILTKLNVPQSHSET